MLLNFLRVCSLFLLLCIISTHTFAEGERLQYPATSQSTKNVVFVRVQWMSPEEVNVFCNNGVKSEEYIFLGCFDPSNNTLYVPEPRNFNDYERLEILGHEFWHALGAEH